MSKYGKKVGGMATTVVVTIAKHKKKTMAAVLAVIVIILSATGVVELNPSDMLQLLSTASDG